MFNIRAGTRVHPPSPAAPPLGGEEGEARHGEIVLTPLTPRYFEHMAGVLGAGGKALKLLLEARKKERAL